MRQKFLLCAVGFLLMGSFLWAQTDRTFWFVAPEVTSGHGDSPVFLRFSTFAEPAVVTISQPANAAFLPIVLNIAANTTQSADLSPFLNVVENQPAATVRNFGLLIESTVDITAYYEVVTSCDCNPEIFPLKGKNALGTEFFTPFQDFWGNGAYNPPASSAIDIVATEDNTTITVTLTRNAVGHPANVPFTITLNRGQTYSIVAAGSNPGDRMVGSRVVSNKPIAITVKDDSVANQGCRDLMGDQIVPTSIIGKEYIAIRGFLNSNEKVFVLATENNTEVFIDGNASPAAQLQQGQVWNVTLNNPSMFIRTSANAYVLQVTGYGCELGQSLLPPIVCTGSTQVGFTRSSASPFSLNIITKVEFINGFIMNGSPALIPGTAFTLVPGTGGVWASAQISFNLADVPLNTAGLVSNSLGRFHMGLINGNVNSGCRYGYFSDYGGLSLGADIAICQGNNAVLDAGGGYTTYLWSTGATTQTIVASTPGSYWVTVTQQGCEATDTIEVANFPLPVVTLNQNLSYCDTINGVTLDAGPGFASYLWNTGDTTQSIQVMAGIYYVTVTNEFECSSASTDSAAVFYQSPMALFAVLPDTIGLKGQPFQFNDQSQGGNTNISHWNWDFGDGQTAIGPNPSHSYAQAGEYLVTLTITNADSCESTYTQLVIVIDELVFPNIITPNGDGLNDLLVFKGLEMFPNSRLSIFNRWGQMIYESPNYLNNWNGGKFPSGTYYYILELNNQEKSVQKGTLTIIRN